MAKKLKVIIRCIVYNHEPYLRDCLEGFVMQKTNFAFKAVVHDDCSTDGSVAIIREYAEKYPDIIEPIYEIENLYSKGDGSLRQVMDAATMNRSDYIAYCEGDDYWIDPHKLQKQVDYMDAHPECTMTYTDVDILTQNGILTLEEKEKNFGKSINEDKTTDPKDIIIQGRAAIFTCSTVYKSNIKEDYPEAAKRCCVGDTPLEIFAALKGKVYGFSDKTAVYRYSFPGSWSANQKIIANEKTLKKWLTIVDMMNAMNDYSNGKYSREFIKSATDFLLWGLSDHPHLFFPACQDKKCMELFDYKNAIYYPNNQSQIREIITKLKYFPFNPYNHALKNLVLKLSVWQRIKVLWHYFFRSAHKKSQ